MGIRFQVSIYSLLHLAGKKTPCGFSRDEFYLIFSSRNWDCSSFSAAACDPCGERQIFGNWDFVYCRGPSKGKDNEDGKYDGYVTNFHFSDLKLRGSLPEELCLFGRAREIDFDGNRLVGAIPNWLSTCFKDLAELDLSFNQLDGPLPSRSFFTELKSLEEFEVGHNGLDGTIPDFADAPLRELDLGHNRLTGGLPATLSKLRPTLTALTLDNNDLSGPLGALAGFSLFRVTVHNNAGLCGMVPASVKYANGYDPTGTKLGQPC